MNISAKLKVSASKSATSASPKPLAVIFRDRPQAFTKNIILTE
jgi:hypothetical protein